MNLYRDFVSQEEIDAQYNIGASMPGWEKYIERYLRDSAATRETLECEIDVSYGPTVDETLDIFPSATSASPVFVFIHGGYWRALSSKEFSFVANTLSKLGITVIVPNYSLCPAVSIAEITRQNRAVIAWLAEHVEKYNGDADNIYVSGHSAGGHLCAMVCSTDWQRLYGLPSNLIKGGVPISGVFDLHPLRYSYLQPVLMLDHELIQRQSPLLCIPENGPELLVTVGEKESEEFHRQAEAYSTAWRNNGMKSKVRSESGEDHFSILYLLEDEKSALFKEIMQLIDSGKS